MRTFFSILISLAFPSMLFGGDMAGDLFPDGKFDKFETDQWFGQYLASMQEPSLYKIAKKNPNAQIYRITYFPPYSPVVALKLEVRPDGSGILEIKKMEQAELNDGYVPGRMARKDVITIPAERVSYFQHLLKDMDFWSVSTHSPSLGSSVLGGDAFLYEGTTHSKYHVLELQTPDNPKDPVRHEIIAPAEYLFKLAGEKF